ncbi:hypothetical protein AAES_113452 [Amazona aestiva]|uniref:Uncharacterized protein n=1 Tax=Amazona aestiva TaxID=12930 RepID=A0A0Q3PRX6_AMAAE|nr:hypothetical protein AAES_113452 [Amazona aestiva]
MENLNNLNNISEFHWHSSHMMFDSLKPAKELIEKKSNFLITFYGEKTDRYTDLPSISGGQAEIQLRSPEKLREPYINSDSNHIVLPALPRREKGRVKLNYGPDLSHPLPSFNLDQYKEQYEADTR